ncbi:hypothetical protein BV309_00520 [Streptomyces clavuligerus]|uniref:Putative Tra3-like protein n=2 Tax=Streptomyces clavuligerus TaxID=1901 RepID=Q6TMP2_STRCL|nr:putative Tra3-like protein [Streptomyces clavuligerus]AXU16869.1 hypothetical protein D1794_29350 [Streptomyces clavuligerus]EDY48699.1 conserved hypothetical protein [Streptomyces clavuligerus]MBY6301005.1 hypothetical protein [Streptomyces clavuligerus]QPJ96989.1 hypothetical protein GE265_28130 [Streptomyces clavuligerus]
MGSASFHQALAAPQAVVPPSRVDPSIAEAVERQSAAMRALSLLAFPEAQEPADYAPASDRAGPHRAPPPSCGDRSRRPSPRPGRARPAERHGDRSAAVGSSADHGMNQCSGHLCQMLLLDQAAAAKAADAARERVGEYLLAARLDRLREHTLDRTGQNTVAPWADRLAGVRRMPPDDDPGR